MRALVVYESMYGNTHAIADAIGEGLRDAAEVRVVAVGDAAADQLDGIDLLVVGGPTHTHGMSRPATRDAAMEALDKPGTNLERDPDAAGDGVREWLESLGPRTGRAAAFDTRVDMAAVVTGRASKGIAKQLGRHGFELVEEPESFLVTKETHLEPHEHERAVSWGRALAGALSNRR